MHLKARRMYHRKRELNRFVDSINFTICVKEYLNRILLRLTSFLQEGDEKVVTSQAKSEKQGQLWVMLCLGCD